MKKMMAMTTAAVMCGGFLATAWGAANVPVNAMTTEAAAQTFAPGQAFAAKELPFAQSMTVLDATQIDVTGDGEADDVLLLGHKEKADDLYSTDVTVVVKDGKAKTYAKLSVGKVDGGYEPKMTSMDFNEDGASDLFVQLANGGSGGTSTYSLLTFAGGKGKELVPQEKLSEGITLEAKFIDGFKVQVTNKLTGKTSTIDISAGKEAYLDAGIYDKAGKLLIPVKGAYDGYSALTPQIQPDGTIALAGVQQIWGAAHADTIGIAKTVWALENGQLTLKEAVISPLDRDNLPSARVEANKPFTEKDAKPNTMIVDAKYADVTGDGVKDDILLVGTKEADSPYVTDLRVVVKDGKTGKEAQTSVGEENGGYEPALFIGQFNKTPGKEVLVETATGGSGGVYTYSLLSFADNKPAEVVKQSLLNQGLSYDIQFADQFKVNLTSTADKDMQTIDVKGAKDAYIEMGIYARDGVLKEKTTGMIDGFGQLAPIDSDEDGVLELRGLQRISGAYHADGLATAVSVWKVDGDKLMLQTKEIVPLKR
ncbi:hypothetical protein ACTID9_24860 [Brevibacillus fluminis]|uniref:hypothetical protein n=1 Tax=Brevibacillus fluminis TaxID=511487 RepID=UPI003F8BC7E1